MTDTRLSYEAAWPWLAAIFVCGWLVYLLAPILTPFLLAGLFGYLGDPLVDRLEAHRLSRSAATSAVFVLLFGIVVLAPLLLVPMLETQIGALIKSLPRYIDWLTETFLPGMQARLGVDPTVFDAEKIKAALAANWQEAGGMAAHAVAYVSRSGMAMVGWLAGMVLVPVLTFYTLRDWDLFVAALRDLLPRNIEPTVVALARESDARLAALLRGQFMVMLCLGTVYSVGLALAGLDTALLIGMSAGAVSFVPYLGVIVGIVSASAAMLIQTRELMPLIPVVLVFGVGQMLEGMVLTPWLVGDRIGLHPVTVIFAVLAGGQLFGFLGVLLALPVAAVLVVLIRHARHSYQSSALYGQEGETGQQSDAEP
ncbi:MAG: AI-2E family transporter [Gammaproteobacteria bacterium]|jgi:predicted PurR-regulated permease PerM